tara:strand:- start:326 stop:955 length:630 start_codon:yes stop_codon:yes gene_type:complete
MKKINIFNLFLMNIIIFVGIYFLHSKSVEKFKILSKKCNYFVQISVTDIGPDLFTNIKFSYYLKKTKDVFIHSTKEKYNIQNSDTGFIIIKQDDFECQNIIKNIKVDIKNENLSKIIERKLEENINLFYAVEFEPFKKSFELKTEDWELIIAFLKKFKNRPALKIEKIKKLEVFSSIDFKVIPTILIFFFGNFIFIIFFFFRDKIKKII